MNGTWGIKPYYDSYFYPYRLIYLDELGNTTGWEMPGIKPRHIRRAKRAITRYLRKERAARETIREFNEAKEI